MAVNLKTLSANELEALIQDASAHLQGARKNLVKDVRAKIDALLKDSGLTLDDVYHRRATKQAKAGKASNALKGKTVAPKYRNPEDASQTWTGRGRKPSWVAEALRKRGVTIDSLLIVGGKTTAKKSSRKVAKNVAKKAAKKTVRRKVKS
ncbi:H-NS histone family protein [Dyella sp. EPa41]|uniref:H-NS histone family protein n=1 Tax=Dyella sp. EPa41 TaxID=1561194 RepID=UPI001915F6B7|nr:H-NS histone family protein [Dyella sp. EPa41]